MAMLINECLCFITKQYDNLNKVNLTSSLDFYQLKVLVDAKEIIVAEYEKVGDANNIKSFKTKRKENSPGAKSKVIKDILDIWDVVDTTLAGKLGVTFVAADPNQLPSVNADQFNLQFLIGAINKLQDEVKQQRGSLEGITQSLTAVHTRLDSFSSVDSRSTEKQESSTFHSVNKDSVIEVRKNGKRRLSGDEEREKFNASASKRIATETTLVSSTPLATEGTTFFLSSSASSPAPLVLQPSRPAPLLASLLTLPPPSPSNTALNPPSAPHPLLVPELLPVPQEVSTSTSNSPPTLPPVKALLPPDTGKSIPTPKDSYATTADTAKEKWTLFQARKKKKIVPVVGSGTGEGNILEAIPRPPPRDYWEISISRIKDTSTEDQVRRQLHNHGIEVRKITLFPSKIKGTKAGRICVAREHRDRVKDAKVWPAGCQVADWIHKPKGIRTPRSVSSAES